MDFQKEYQQKLVSADEAVKIIKSGDWVDYGWCTGTPDALDKALAKRTDELKDVKLRGGILLKPLAVSAVDSLIIHQSVIPSCHVTTVTPFSRMTLLC